MRRMLIAALLFVAGGSEAARASLAILDTWNPSQAGSLCGLGFDPVTRQVWVFGCSEGEVERYTPTGTFVSSVARPGESANDVDVELSSVGLTLSSTSLPAGSLLFVNGESGAAEIYAVDKVSGAVLATLGTAFGVSHVVGGAHHKSRQTLFLVQDNVPAAADENRIAEIDLSTGAVLNSFQTTGTFSINFGDMEVCSVSGNLLLASSDESRLAEYGPAGAFIQYHDLPAGVSGLSGIGLDDQTGDVWVSSTTGSVWRLAGGPCAPAADIPALSPRFSLFLAALLFSGVLGSLARARTRAA